MNLFLGDWVCLGYAELMSVGAPSMRTKSTLLSSPVHNMEVLRVVLPSMKGFIINQSLAFVIDRPRPDPDPTACSSGLMMFFQA